MKKTILLLIAMTVVTAATAIERSELVKQASLLKGKKKAELKTAVYGLIGSPKTLDYGSGISRTWWGFYQTDRIVETNECVNRYSAKKFYFPESNSGAAISGMNIEHSFPKSWWGKSTTVNAYKDLYNLYPSDSKANSSKSNYPMGVVTTVTQEEEGYDKVGTGTIDGVSGRNCWEPGDQYKGDFARTYMYMATAYQNLTWSGTEGLQQLENNTWPTLKQWAYTLYLQWLKDDPVDQLETDRNDAVATIQGNRNLFVDFPYLAEYIWGDSTDVAFDPATTITTAADDDRYQALQPDYVAKPIFSPDGGVYSEPLSVTIACPTEGAAIRYTTDGTSPTTGGTMYTGPIAIGDNTTLKAVAISPKGIMSAVATASYVFYTAEAYFAETFDQCSGTGGNDGQFSGNGVASSSSTFKPDNDGWVTTAYFGGDRCARFGSGKAAGVVTTPTFTVEGTSVFTFMAAPWGTDGTTLTLTVNGNATLSQTQFAMKQGEWTTYSATLTGSGNVSITFTPDKRVFLDEVYARPMAKRGDINGDGKTDIADVTALVNIILGRQPAAGTAYDTATTDINGDGKTDVADITALINIILEKE